MRKRRLIVLLTTIATISLGIVLLLVLLPSEPSYKGRSLSTWLDELPAFVSVNFNTRGGTQVVWSNGHAPPAAEAICHMGTNCCSYLVRIMQARDSQWRKRIRSVQIRLKVKN